MVAVLAVAFATTANAGGWRSLRIDASSEESFERSVAEFQEKLSPARRYVFEWALRDAWVEGERKAQAEQREYTAAEYFERVHGLRYKDVVRLTDPSGKTARSRYYAAIVRLRGPRAASALMPSQQSGGMIGFSGEQVRGIDNQAHAMQQRLMTKGTLY